MITCCDVKQLPSTKPDAVKRIKHPNGPVELKSGIAQKLTIEYPSIVVCFGGSLAHSVHAYPEKHSTIDTLAAERVYRAQPVGPQRSMFYLHAPGPWSIISEGQDLACTVLDAHDGIAALFYGPAAQETGGALAMSAPASVAVGAGSGLAIAANAARKTLYMRNVSTAGQVISLSFNGNAVLNDGITLNVDDWIAFDRPTLCPISLVNAIASAAAGKLAFQEGT